MKKESMKLEIKEPTKHEIYKTSDNRSFEYKEAAEAYEAKLAFDNWYWPIRIPWEGSHVDSEKIYNFLTKHKKEIIQLYQDLEELKEPIDFKEIEEDDYLY